MPNILNTLTEALEDFTPGETPGSEPPPETPPAEEPPAEEPDEDADADEPEEGEEVEAFEIPGVGEFTLDEIKTALDSRGRLTEMEAKLAEATMTAAELEEARLLQSLAQDPAFRKGLQTLVDNFEKGSKTVATNDDNAPLDTSRIKDPRMDQLLKEIEPLRKIAVEAQQEKLLKQYDDLKATYLGKFPGIVTEEIWEAKVAALQKERGNDLNFKDIEFAVVKHIAENGIQKAKDDATKDALERAGKKGTRLLVRPKAEPGEPAKAPARVDRNTFQKMLVNALSK